MSQSKKPRTIFKVARGSGAFTQLPNAMLRDKRLSLEARGMLGTIVSHPDDWIFDEAQFRRQCDIGRDRLKRILREIEAAGYSRSKRPRRADGTWDDTITFFACDPRDLIAATSDGFPVTGQPSPDEQHHTNIVERKKITSPLPPSASRRGRAGKIEALIADVRAVSGREQIVDAFFAPLLRQRQISAPVPSYALGELADWARDLPPEALKFALDKLLTDRRVKVFQADIREALKAGRDEAQRQAVLAQAAVEKARREAEDPSSPQRQALVNHAVALHDRLRNRLGREVFEGWLSGVTCDRIQGDRLIVIAPSKLHKRWILSNWTEVLDECAAAEFPGISGVDIELATEQ